VIAANNSAKQLITTAFNVSSTINALLLKTVRRAIAASAYYTNHQFARPAKTPICAIKFATDRQHCDSSSNDIIKQGRFQYHRRAKLNNLTFMEHHKA